MPTIRLLAPYTDREGNPYAPGEELDVDDATAADLRGAGKASLIEDEKKAAAQAAEGVYDARTTRADSGEVSAPPKEEPHDKGKKG